MTWALCIVGGWFVLGVFGPVPGRPQGRHGLLASQAGRHHTLMVLPQARHAGRPLHVAPPPRCYRSFDHYFGFAPFAGRLRVPSGTPSRTGTAAPCSPTTSRSSRRRTSATPGTSSTREWDGGAMDGFYTTDGIDCMGYYTGDGASVLLRPVRRLHAVRELLLLAAGSDLAEPLLPRRRNVRRHHDERRLGLRGVRLSDHPRPARGGRRELEGLQHRLGQRAVRQHRQRVRVLEALGARTNGRAGSKGELPERPASAGGCRRSPSSSRATHAGGTSTRRPTSRSGWASSRS